MTRRSLGPRSVASIRPPTDPRVPGNPSDSSVSRRSGPTRFAWLQTEAHIRHRDVYRDILAPTDGSSAASKAVDHAVELANGIGDAVHVPSVADSSESPMACGEETVEGIEQTVRRTAEEMSENRSRSRT